MTDYEEGVQAAIQWLKDAENAGAKAGAKNTSVLFARRAASFVCRNPNTRDSAWKDYLELIQVSDAFSMDDALEIFNDTWGSPATA